MSVRAYEDYRAGGEWLPHVPTHWGVAPVKAVAQIEMGQSPSSDDCNQEGSGVPFLQGCAEFGPKHPTPLQYCEVAKKFAEPDDLLFSVRAPVGAMNVADQRYGIGRGLCAIRATNIDRHFLTWAIDFSREQLNAVATGSTYAAVSVQQVAIASVPVPPKTEQVSIAAFLDRETGKIDALVATQRRLIELLKEKRQAVISHAVTKGIDPTAPMKDSGVEWLGEVPVHWQALQLGRLCRQVSDGPHFSPTYVDEGVMFLSARNVRVDCWSLEDAKFISEADYEEFCRRVIPEPGDILYTKGGTTGIARVVDLLTRFQVWVHIAVLKLWASQADPHFVAYALNSTAGYEQSQLHTRGATNQDLGLTRMIKIWLALPPMDEQRAIVSHLEALVGKIDVLSSEAASTISLLNERRSALISAAVTGKIDVRGPAPEQVEAV